MPEALVGQNRFNQAVPEYERRVQEAFRENIVTEGYLASHFPWAVIDIEDETMALDFPEPRPQDSNSLRMLYKGWRCNELKRAAEKKRGRPFDIVVRMRPDILPILNADIFAEVLRQSDPPVVLTHHGRPGSTYLSDVIAVSNSRVADGLATLFAVAMHHPQRKWDLIHSEVPRHLKEIGVVAGAVDLERWVTEDVSTAPKRNRHILFELLAQNRVDSSFFY